MAKRNWDKIRNQSATDTLRNRDVYETQQLDRTRVGKKQSFTSRHIIAVLVGVLCAFLAWMMYSMLDVNTLNNQAAADANMAVVITAPAPAEPRDLADVTWANMLLIEDHTYASYGYTYMDRITGAKYTQAEYDIWLDVHRRINNGECPELLVQNNKNGTKTYVERAPLAPPPAMPREWTHAESLNFLSYGIVENSTYADLGYVYRETYTGTYLTQREYENLQLYTNETYVQRLLDEGLISCQTKTIKVGTSAKTRKILFYTDIGGDVIVPNVPTESAGERYTVPIELDNLTWANMVLVSDDTAVSLGYTHRDTRTGNYYTLVEYEKWRDVYEAAKVGMTGYIFWMDIAEDNNYCFSVEPPMATDVPRERFSSYYETKLMKMNLVRNDKFWGAYGYPYYDYHTGLFYSEAEYQIWLDVQNKVATGVLRVPKTTQNEIRSGKIRVTDVVAAALDPIPVKHTYADGFMYVHFMKIIVSFAAGFIVYALLKALLKKNLDAQNLMNDTSDINQYENDQHIALPEEIQRKFDWFPDVGAHCPVQVSSMISHMMLTNKGLNKVQFAKRATKDVVDEDGEIVTYKGEVLYDDNGNVLTETVPLIDTEFAEALYEASGAPKEVRKSYDATKIPYNPDGKDRTKQCGVHKTVADAINKTWTLPTFEPQRPAGAYIVDTEPVNTMVLAITRAGKGEFSPV